MRKVSAKEIVLMLLSCFGMSYSPCLYASEGLGAEQQTSGEDLNDEIPVPDLDMLDLEVAEKDIYRDEVKDEKIRVIFAAIRSNARGARPKVIRFIRDHPGLINRQYGKYGLTFLHAASSSGNGRLVKFLLRHGADLGVKTYTGYSPLYGAFRNGHVWVACYLVKHSLGCAVLIDEPEILECISRQKDCGRMASRLRLLLNRYTELLGEAAQRIDLDFVSGLDSDSEDFDLEEEEEAQDEDNLSR
jgi:ankyrin repeat protein